MILLPLNDRAAPRPKEPRAALVGRPERFRGILDHRHAVPRQHGFDPVVVRGLSVEIDDHGSLRQWLASALTVLELLSEQVGRDLPCHRIGIDQDGGRAEVADRVDRGRKGEGRGKDVVTRSDIHLLQDQVQCGGSGGESHREAAPACCGDRRTRRPPGQGRPGRSIHCRWPQ